MGLGSTEERLRKKMLPSFYGIIETEHYIRGRIRLKIEILKENPYVAKELEKKLDQFNILKNYRISTVTGSLLLEFDEDQVDVLILVSAIIKILGLEDEVNEIKEGKAFKEINDILDSVSLTIYNKTKGILDLKSLIALSFFSLGIYKIRKVPTLPNGTNLIWWAYRTVKGR